MLTLGQKQLILRIDARAKDILFSGGGDKELITALQDTVEDIKKIIASNTHGELDLLCKHYYGFYRYIKLLQTHIEPA